MSDFIDWATGLALVLLAIAAALLMGAAAIAVLADTFNACGFGG